MNSSDRSPSEPTPEALGDLKRLKAAIDRAVADGVITSKEMQKIKEIAWKDEEMSPEEVELCQTLVLDKIRSGELVWEF